MNAVHQSCADGLYVGRCIEVAFRSVPICLPGWSMAVQMSFIFQNYSKVVQCLHLQHKK